MVRSISWCDARLSKAWSKARTSQTPTLQSSQNVGRASPTLQAHRVHTPTEHPGVGGCRTWCQAETRETTTYRRTICTRHARKTRFAQRPLKTNRKKRKKSTAAMVSLQSTGRWSFADTFLAFPSRERLQRGRSLGKAAMTCRSLLISLGRVSQRPGMLPASHTHTIQQRELNRRQRDARHRAVVLRKDTMLHTCASTSWRISNYGTCWAKKCPFFGDKRQGESLDEWSCSN